MILLDTNIFIYASGEPHPHKAPSKALLDRIAGGHVDAAIDGEVLQEILHRYRAIRRWAEGRQVYDHVRRIILQIIPVSVDMLDDARNLMDAHSQLTARDALHAAACRHAGATALCSYDTDFDAIPGLKRLEPQQVP